MESLQMCSLWCKQWGRLLFITVIFVVNILVQQYTWVIQNVDVWWIIEKICGIKTDNGFMHFLALGLEAAFCLVIGFSAQICIVGNLLNYCQQLVIDFVICAFVLCTYYCSFFFSLCSFCDSGDFDAICGCNTWICICITFWRQLQRVLVSW